MRTLQSLTIAVSSDPDPADPSSSSGLPSSTLKGLAEFVGNAVPIARAPGTAAARAAIVAGAALGVRPADFKDPRAARARLWTVGRASLPMSLARERVTRKRLAAAGAIDGLIQYGGEYRAPAGVPMVTYQDSTLIQAQRAYDWSHLQGLSDRDLQRLLAEQREAYTSATACCVISHWVAQSLVGDYGIPEEKIHVVGLGANHVIDASWSGRDWSPPRFLFVGVDWERKNGPMLLRAFGRLRDEVPDATLDLVGGHPRVDQPGVCGHGPLRLSDPADREKLAGLYQSATAFVMPSLHEPGGTVHTEAAAAGIPSIGSSSGGAATAIGDAGFVVDPGSEEDLLDAMRKLADPAVAQALGERGIERAGLFTWRKVAERLVRALRIPGVDDSGLAEFLPALEASGQPLR